METALSQGQLRKYDSITRIQSTDKSLERDLKKA